MERVTVIVKNPTGIHAKPASMIVETASTFRDTSINIIRDYMTINAKSILGILGLEATSNTELIIEATGGDEKAACNAIKTLFDNNFGEE